MAFYAYTNKSHNPVNRQELTQKLNQAADLVRIANLAKILKEIRYVAQR